MHDIIKMLIILIPLLALYGVLVWLSRWSAKREVIESKKRKDQAMKEFAKTYADVNRIPFTVVGTGPEQVAAAKQEVNRNIRKAQAQKRAVKERESSRREFEVEDDIVRDAVVVDLFRRSSDPIPEPTYVSHDIPATSHDSSHSHDSSSSHSSFDGSSSFDSGSSHDSGGSGGSWD